MFLEYAYCSSCGSEFIETKLPFVATYADGDFVRCTNCGNEFAIEKINAAESLSSVLIPTGHTVTASADFNR